MSRWFFAAPVVLAAWFAAVPAWADNPGVTAVPVLQVPLGARALGMGGAFTAVATDATGPQYNPAGIARLNAHEADLTYIAGAGQTTLQHIAYAGPTPFGGISGLGDTSVALSALISQNGTIQVNQLNADGSLASSQNLSAGGDLVIDAGYAERIGVSPLPFIDNVSVDHYVGVTGEYIRSTLVQSYHATAFAANAGYLGHSPDTGLSLGLSMLHFGSRLSYVNSSDPLPASLRGGLAWQGGIPSVHNVIVAMDSSYVIDEKVWRFNVGCEYFWLKSYGVRLGYQVNAGDQGGLTVGVGYRWKGRILIDYAYDVGDLLGNAQRVTLSYRFGGESPSLRGRGRRPFIESTLDHPEMSDLEQRQPAPDEVPQPRPVPRDERRGAPGWIY